MIEQSGNERLDIREIFRLEPYDQLPIRGVISTFYWGPTFLFYFSMPPDYWKIGKKQHFIMYSNLTLFIVIVPFILSFFSFLSFSCFFFLFFLGGDGPQPPQMTPLLHIKPCHAGSRPPKKPIKLILVWLWLHNTASSQYSVRVAHYRKFSVALDDTTIITISQYQSLFLIVCDSTNRLA